MKHVWQMFGVANDQLSETFDLGHLKNKKTLCHLNLVQPYFETEWDFYKPLVTVLKQST